MTDPADGLPPGYEFLRPLGAGGFGEVVLARHRRLGRQVAVKRIHEHALGDAESLARFRREARVLAATSCASVVRVYDLHADGDGAHLVMEYCPGHSLAALLEQGPLPAGQALRVLQDVAEALATMSAHGVVHRDVKPDNVFVLPDGRAKLGDFGLARALADRSAFRTAGGAAMGTPAYFPPEVSQGLGEADERSDAYSFAVMAYETLTGGRPFDAPDALSLITAHWTKEPVLAAAAVPGFPERASRALQRGMSKQPADRPLPRELVSELGSVAASSWPEVSRRAVGDAAPRRGEATVRRAGFQPGGPRPASAAVRRPAPPRRLPRIAAVVGLVGVVVGGAVVWRVLAADGELEVASVRVVVDPASGRGACPSADFRFTAVLAVNGSPGTASLQWVRPDGATTDPVAVPVQRGRREVRVQLPFSVSGTAPMAGDVEVRLLAPEVRSARLPIRYECPPA